MHSILPEGIAGIPVAKGIAKRFEEFMLKHKMLSGCGFVEGNVSLFY